MPIKDFIHHYPRALFNDIPRVGAHFYDIPGSGRTLTTYPGQVKLRELVCGDTVHVRNHLYGQIKWAPGTVVVVLVHLHI